MIIPQTIGPLRLVGTALIGPDFTGNARGQFAIDIQAYRGGVAQNVASGYKSLALGVTARASGSYSNSIGGYSRATALAATAVGASAHADASQSTAVGQQAVVLAGANKGTAIGNGATVTYNATGATAIGYFSYVGVNSCIGLGGPVIIAGKGPALGSAEIQQLSGAVIVITTAKRNLKVVFDETVTFPSTPAQSYFYVNQVGLWATDVAVLTVQPTVRFGIVGTLAKYLTAIITTHLTAANKRELYNPIVDSDGEVNVTAGVTVGATATTFNGRFFWIGVLVQADASAAQ